MMKRHDIRVVHAPKDRILEARALLARRGIYCELYGPTPDTLITCAAQASSPTTDPHAQPLRLPAPQGTATRIRPLHHPPCGLLPPSHPAS